MKFTISTLTLYFYTIFAPLLPLQQLSDMSLGAARSPHPHMLLNCYATAKLCVV